MTVFAGRCCPIKGFSIFLAPPRFVNLVTETAGFIDQQALDQSGRRLVIEIFRLRHASATNRSYQLRDQKMEDPGVANILKTVLLSHQASGNATAPPGREGEKAEKKKGGANKDTLTINASHASAPSSARIEAVPQINAVLVQDTPERMSLYRALIKELDRPQKQIEISLSIIDVNASNLDELGVDWNVSHNFGDGNSIDFITPNATGGGYHSATVVGQGLTSFVTRVKLMSQQGKARVASRPAILTENNTEAVLDFSSTFYVPLEGREAVRLESVAYGTVLNLRPRIVEVPGKQRVALKIHIEDGDQAVNREVPGSKLPLVNRAMIDTLATINENESLLIGGYFRDMAMDGESRIPLLGDIPLLGELFKSKTTRIEQTVRMFLLQPRILEPGQMSSIHSDTRDEPFIPGDRGGTGKRGAQRQQAGKTMGKNVIEQQSMAGTACYPTSISDSLKSLLISQGYSFTEVACVTIDGSPGVRVFTKPASTQE